MALSQSVYLSFMLKSLLQKIGLSPNESIVYLAALKLGTQDASTLAKETGMSRLDVINTIQELIDRSFVSKFSRGKDYFTAEPLGIIIKISETQKNVPKSSLTLLKKNSELFDAYVNPSFVKPEIAFYAGKKGLIPAYEDTLTSKTEILAIAPVDYTEAMLPRYVPRYCKRRKTAGILIKAIFPDTPTARARQKKDKEDLRISRLIPADRYYFDMEINIYDDKVAYFSIKEEFAAIIKSADVAANMRQMFNLCWAMAEYYEANRL